MIAKEDPIYALDLLQTYCFSSSGDVMMNIEPEACLLGGDIAFDLGHYKLATNFYVTAYQKCAYQAAKYGTHVHEYSVLLSFFLSFHIDSCQFEVCVKFQKNCLHQQNDIKTSFRYM